MSAAAVWWEWNVRLGLEAGRPLGPGLYYEMRYESLVSEPAAECAGLCAFLGLPFDKSMLEFHRGRTKAKPGRDAKSAWLPVTPGLRDWRTQMAVRDLERVEAMVGGLLTELKYARAVSVLPNELIEHAAKIRETFAAKGRTSAASSSSEATADEDIHS